MTGTAADRVSPLSPRPGRWGRPARLALALLAALTLASTFWLAGTDDVRVWPARNLAASRLERWWRQHRLPALPAATGKQLAGGTGTLRGHVRDPSGRPIEGARLLLAEPDGTTHEATSDAGGSYLIADIPAGFYVPVAGAAGYADTTFGRRRLPGWLGWLDWLAPPGVAIHAGAETIQEVILAPASAPAVAAASRVQVGEAETLTCEHPMAARARRRQIELWSGPRPDPPALLYTPATSGEPADSRPLLLTVYPGPAGEWECASVPLAAAGYAVVATGPAYSFDLEPGVDELMRLLQLARAGQLPGVDGTRVAVLGGSYSSLHVLRLLERGGLVPAGSGSSPIRAALLLGPVADLFDMRRRLEDGTFIPPFGLDQALLALGPPDRQPLRYWRYSGVYHVRADLPPVALIHSRSDDVVPFQQSERLAAALAAAGVPHELHLLEGGGHYLLAEDAEARLIYDLSLAFLKMHLGSSAAGRRPDLPVSTQDATHDRCSGSLAGRATDSSGGELRHDAVRVQSQT